MTLVQNLPFIAIMLYLAGGVSCCVLKPRASKGLCLLINAAVSLMMLLTLLYTAKTGGSYVFKMGHFPAPWGNELRIGPLEALLGFTISLVMLLTLLGGMKHIFADCEPGKISLYFTAANLLMVSLIALIFTNDLFTGYVFVEINTLASCALVMLNYRSGKALVSTMRYLMMSLLGSGLFLLGVIILYDLTGHLLMEPMGTSILALQKTGQYALPLTMTFGLLAVGLSLKSALWPFSEWLPGAHASATAASSGILSGLVLKGYIFLLIKLICRVAGLDAIRGSGVDDVLFLFGIGAMLIGSVYALHERDLKRLLAYSSIAQVGYIYAGIGLGTEAGMAAACVQIVVHAVTKPMLFCASGALMDVSGGRKDFESLRGAGRRDVLSGAAFAVGAASMIGLPLFAGFITKMQLAQAALGNQSLKCWLLLLALVVSTVLNALYYLPALSILFSRKKGVSQGLRAPRDPLYVIAVVAFVALNFLVGVFPDGITQIIRQGISILG